MCVWLKNPCINLFSFVKRNSFSSKNMSALKWFPKIVLSCNNVHIKRLSSTLYSDFSKIRLRSNNYSFINIISKTHNKSCLILKRALCTKETTDGTAHQYETSAFMVSLKTRKKQAHHSVLIKLSTKEDIPFAVNCCEKFGVIKNAFRYSGVSNKVFMLLEFEEEDSVNKILYSSYFKKIIDAFAVSSRIVAYTKKCEQDRQKSSVSTSVDSFNSSSISEGTVSDLFENIYNTEKLTELDVRLRFFFCCILKELLSGFFPYCDAIPFGSSVNGIGRHGCDLDLMIRLYPEKSNPSSELSFVEETYVPHIQHLQKRFVERLSDLLRAFCPGAYDVEKILHARVPIVKLKHKILGLKIDISVNNLAPVLMSEMLYFFGEIDPRIRPLICAVKKWAREVSVTEESPGSWITNFSLTLLVINFLQNRPTPILPPIRTMMNIIGAEFTKEYRLEYLMTLPELQAKASLNKESIVVLLQEFLAYLGSHPFKNKHISLLTGAAVENKMDVPIFIQNPLEEELNVSNNVSKYELWEMCEKARASAEFLSSNLTVKGTFSKDFSTLLGIPDVRELQMDESMQLDLNLLLSENVKSSQKSGRTAIR